MRLIDGAEYSGQELFERQQAKANGKRHIVYGDSWFGSVKVAESFKCRYKKEGMENTLINEEYVIDKEQGSNDTNKNQHEFIGAIKTNNAWYPKAEIEETMKKWPSGSHLVLKCITPGTGVELIALGYKYNTRKVLCFIMTKDAGATANGTNPYIAKFGDGHGNDVNQRQVNRSDVLSLVLGSADRIDSHNHMRQFLLGLEMRWRTEDWRLRLDMTIIGMTVIDCIRATKYQAPSHKDISVRVFADRLAWDCIHNNFPREFNKGAPPSSHLMSEQEYSSRVVKAQMEGGLIQNQQMARQSAILIDTSSSCEGGTIMLGSSAAPFTIPTTIGVEQGRRRNPRTSASSSDSVLTEPSTASSSYMSSTCCLVIPRHMGESNHDREKSANRRDCKICGSKASFVCSNEICKLNKTHWKGKVFHGFPLCGPTSGVRTNVPDLGGAQNKYTCIEHHRMRARKAREDEAKKIVNAGRSIVY